MSQVVNEVESGQSSVEESMATDMTVVGGNVSDFVSKEPQSAPASYFDSDATVMNQDMSQVVNEVESGQSLVEESMATDMTVVGGNVSDFVSKEPTKRVTELF